MSNRTIKFRVWNKVDFQWVKTWDEFAPLFGTNLKENSIFSLSRMGGEGYEYVVQQFTGLLDKNGKEVYEGDYLISKDKKKYLVEWLDWCGGFYPFNERNDVYRTNDIDDGDLLIIGNIFENPELVKII